MQTALKSLAPMLWEIHPEVSWTVPSVQWGIGS